MIMKVLISVVTAVALVAAHGDDYLHARHLHQRQAPSSSSSSQSSAPPATVSATVPPVTVNGSATAAPTSTTPIIAVSLLATNPTAVPLASIVSNEPSAATQPLASTAVPGSIPTFLPGAPALPNPVTLNPANYPKLDLPPPIDSPEVLQWIQEVKDTGIVIPGFAPTNPGGCPNNTAAVADSTRCWWSCSGCVASFDITQCPDPLHWGLTYDDGPSFYTSKLLSYLDQENLKSTFFVVGSRALQFPAILQTEYMAQHQIAVHTWSHPSLTTLTNEEIIAELGWSKKIIKDVLGVTPNMMRPPYGDIDNRVRAISVAMGLTPVIWTRVNVQVTFDTGDFNIHGGTTTVSQVLQNWENILGNISTINNGFIVLEHDLFEQTVEVATGYILPDALAHKPPFTIQPVVDCLHMPLSNAYIETNDNKTNPPIISGYLSFYPDKYSVDLIYFLQDPL
ncbi:glycoside hydrolase/deacetylase [Phlegmacium glaucopus]|nr:glycoside hydrolase/deacetylase [Phlegmacium glaucopus]